VYSGDDVVDIAKGVLIRGVEGWHNWVILAELELCCDVKKNCIFYYRNPQYSSFYVC
jgi:hypothetical protein